LVIFNTLSAVSDILFDSFVDENLNKIALLLSIDFKISTCSEGIVKSLIVLVQVIVDLSEKQSHNLAVLEVWIIKELFTKFISHLH
jgi:hypothetical protein